MVNDCDTKIFSQNALREQAAAVKAARAAGSDKTHTVCARSAALAGAGFSWKIQFVTAQRRNLRGPAGNFVLSR
jgi:hypothetical protein